MKKLLTILLLFPVVLYAQLANLSKIQPQATSPTAYLSPSSFTVPTTTAGTAGSSVSLTYALTNLTGSNGTLTFTTGVQVNVNGAGFTGTSPVTGIAACSSCTILVEFPASASAGAYSGTFSLTATGANTASATGTGTVTAPSSASWNFSNTAQSATGFNNMYGNPGTSGGLTSTDGGTGWTLTTNASDWESFYGTTGTNTDGGTDSTNAYLSYFPQPAIAGNFLQASKKFSDMTDGLYPFAFTNLPAGNYTIQIIGSQRASVWASDSTGGQIWLSDVHLQFGTGSDQELLVRNIRNNTQTVVTYTGTITSGQAIRFGVFAWYNSANFTTYNSVIDALRITKNY